MATDDEDFDGDLETEEIEDDDELIGDDDLDDDLIADDEIEDDDLVADDDDDEEDDVAEDEDFEEEEDDDDEDEDDEEALDVILVREKVLEDEELSLVDDGRDVLTAPIGDDEFTCRSCFLVKRRAQLADEKKLICFDCA